MGTHMTGRVAIVTGGTRGIGKAISISLKAAGYKVAANYSGNDEAAAAFTKETGIRNCKFDVSDFEACQKSVAEIAADLGPVEVLVNNAGITRDGTLHKMTHGQWQQVIDVNLGGCFNMCRAVIESMRQRNFGRIVNVGSVNGQAGQYGQVNYAAAKSGIHGFTKAMAQEGAGKGITVNAIAPGHIMTENMQRMWREQGNEKGYRLFELQYPVRRTGSPDDIAHAVAFLCSPQAAFINGVLLPVDGGMSIQLQENIVMEVVDYIRENPELRSHFDGYKRSPKRH